MKKTFILAGTYLISSFLGAFTGAIFSHLPCQRSQMGDLAGFMMMCPLFQFIAVITFLRVRSLFLSIVFILICVGAIAASAIWYYKSNQKLALLTFAFPVFISSLPGVVLLYEACAA